MNKLMISYLAFFIVACNSKPSYIQLNTGMEGKSMASFEFLLLDSTTKISTASIPEGRPVVMVYFSPYCPFSQAEVRNLAGNLKSLEGVRVYLLTNYPLGVLRTFDSAFNLDKSPSLVTGQDYAEKFISAYNPPRVPVTAIFDRKKKLKKAFIGTMTAEQIKSIAN